MHRAYVFLNFRFDYHKLGHVHIYQKSEHHDTVEHYPEIDVSVVLVLFVREVYHVVRGVAEKNTLAEDLYNT